MLTEETKRRIQSCRDYLVGKLPMPTDQVELITFGLIYKFMDDLDEESVNLGGQRSFFTDELAPYRWRELLKQTLSADDRMKLFARGLELLGGADMEVERKVDGEVKKVRIVPAEHLPVMFRDVFRNSFLKFRDGRTLTLFLTELNGFAYSHSEELGNAFEFLLQSMGTQGENGQFRTPRHIIDFVVACLEPRPEEKILDPACGTGGFLVSAFKHILAAHTSPGSTVAGDRLKRAERQQLYGNLTGYDITDLMVKLSKVNLFLHGFPDPAVHIYDTLSNDARWNEKADLILANPPFMTPKGGVTPHTKFRIPAKKAEVLFTDYIAEHLSPDGRAGIIVPNGIVATAHNAYVKLRKFLVEDSLVAVISLPAGVFKPYSGVKTSILILDKKLARTAKEILFLKITADGFDLGDKRTPIEANDLSEAERLVKLWLAGKLEGGMESSVAWKAVEKKTLLESRSVNLQAEQLLGVTSGNGSGNACWPMITIKEVARVVSGHGFPLDHQGQTDAEIPFYKVSDMNLPGNERFMVNHNNAVSRETLAKLKGKSHPAGTIIFPKIGAAIATNKKRMLTREATFDNNVMGIVPSAQIEPKFLLGLLDVFDLSEWASEAHPPSMRQGTVEDQEIPLPPLEEQRRIVAEIEGYQKVLNGTRQILASYKPRVEVSPDWETVTMEDVAEFKNGVNYTKESEGTGIKVLGVRHFQSHVVAPLDDLDEINPEGVLSDGHVLEDGDLIFVRSNGNKELVGRCLLVQPNGLRLTHSAFTIRMRLDRNRCEPKFYAFLLRLPEFRAQMMGGGANINNLSQDILKAIEIPLPPLEEQRRILAELDAEAAQMETVRSLIPRFEAKIQRVLDRVWGTGES